VVILTHSRLYGEVLARALCSSEGVSGVSAVGSCVEAARVVKRHPSTVVLVDVSGDDRIQAVALLRRMVPDVLAVALNVRDGAGEVIACAEAGIVGYVTREGSLGDVVAAIEGAARGETAFSPRVAGDLLRHVARLADQTRPPDQEPAPLTRREAEVLALIADGLSNKEIAHQLIIELPTVKNHVHHILEKLQVDKRAEAASLFRQGRTR
jgi:two-component system, NarL family, nitrate/nitrite response regulator NarL